MSTTYVNVTFKTLAGVAFDPTTVKLSNQAATIGVKRDGNDDVVVADNTAMTKISTGVYQYSFTDPAADLTYTAYIEYVISGETYWIEKSVTGATSATEPITLTEAKLHLRVTETADDSLISSLITAARQYAEPYTRRCFITQTKTLAFDSFPASNEIRLPWSKLAGITSITYYDTANALQTLDAANYLLDTVNEPGRVRLISTESWPSVYDRINAVTITYTAGYGAAADVPEGIKAAMKLLVGHWYENREGVITGTIVTEMKMAVDALLSFYRVLEAV